MKNLKRPAHQHHVFWPKTQVREPRKGTRGISICGLNVEYFISDDLLKVVASARNTDRMGAAVIINALERLE